MSLPCRTIDCISGPKFPSLRSFAFDRHAPCDRDPQTTRSPTRPERWYRPNFRPYLRSELSKAGTADARADVLLRRAKLQAVLGRRNLAFRDIKEAHSLAPGNPNVAALVQMLQNMSVTSSADDVDVLLPRFISGNKAAGETLATAVSEPSIGVRFLEGNSLLELLEKWSVVDSRVLGRILISLSLNGSSDVSKRLVTKLSNGLEENISAFVDCGTEGIEAFTNILLRTWDDNILQKKAAGIFTTQLVQHLRPAKDEKLKVAYLNALLAIATSNLDLKPKDNQLPFVVIFPLLSSQNPQTIRSRAVVLLSTLISMEESDSALLSTFKSQLSDFITKQLSGSTSAESIAACSVLASVFPIRSEIAVEVFMEEGLLEEIIQDGLDTDDEGVRTAGLELLSAATVEKKCRTKINEVASEFLQDCTQSTDSSTRALAALVSAKLATASMELKHPDIDLLQIFKDAYQAKNDVAIQSAVEGLAFASTVPKTKEELVADPTFIRSILAILKTPGCTHPLVYGCLSILVNITNYRPPLTEEESRINEIRKIAKDSNVTTADKLDDNVHVAVRCKTVLAAGLLPTLSAMAITSSPASITAISHILLSVSTAPANRGLLAQQGAIKLVLAVLAKGVDSATETTLSHAMAKVLISVNPALVFSSRTPITAPIQPLTALLANDSLPNDLPRFEALLALTNLASAPGDTARLAIVEKSWSHVEPLLLADNPLLARAATELVCNLVACQTGAEKFFSSKVQASGRLHVLLALADVEDLPTRRAAGGALAMLTDFVEVCEGVVGVERGVERLGGMVLDGDEGCVFRGVICVRNLLDAKGGDVKKRFVDMELGEKVKGILGRTENEELKAVCREVLTELA